MSSVYRRTIRFLTLEEEQLSVQNASIRIKVDRTNGFMIDLDDIQDLYGKNLCTLSANAFNVEAVDVTCDLETLAMIPIEVMNSEKLSRVLKCILDLVKLLNSGRK